MRLMPSCQRGKGAKALEESNSLGALETESAITSIQAKAECLEQTKETDMQLKLSAKTRKQSKQAIKP